MEFDRVAERVTLKFVVKLDWVRDNWKFGTLVRFCDKGGGHCGSVTRCLLAHCLRRNGSSVCVCFLLNILTVVGDVVG
jgi:hypothetical protein